MEQCVAVCVESGGTAVVATVRRARFEHEADPADRRNVVTRRAARAVERRSETVVDGLDFLEVIEAHAELLELRRRQIPAADHPG